MLKGLLIVNAKGDVLVSRYYRKDLKYLKINHRRNLADLFRIHVISSKDIRSPVTTIDSHAFFHLKNNNVYLVAVGAENPNVLLIFEFLEHLITIGNSYFGQLNEESIKNNFTIVYDIIDEICDFGYPQMTDPAILKLYIKPEDAVKQRNEQIAPMDPKQIAMQATGVVSWRRPDIKYKKNEAYVDVIESINLIISNTGQVLSCDASGKIMMRSYLSGMPECKFGLNDKIMMSKVNTAAKSGGDASKVSNVELEDLKFHQCVKLDMFESSRTINFIPLDGEFELMRYRLTENLSMPFKVRALVNEISSSKVEFRVSVKALYDPKLHAQNVAITIPAPMNTAKTKIHVQGGKCKYYGSENAFVWRIMKMNGGAEVYFSAEADLTELVHKKPWARPPITMDFQVIMFTASGLTVRFLKIFEKSGYQSVKWVRYMTTAGQYQIRI